jgi:hypothetical protein
MSTLIVVRHGPETATLRGELHFNGGVVLVVREFLNFRAALIKQYGYAVYRHGEELYWYDSWPHPKAPELQDTHPHHKHIPPDIRHNRIPAPGLQFTSPNLPFLIEEIEQELLGEL